MNNIAIVCNRNKPNVVQLAECICEKLSAWGVVPVLDEWLGKRTGLQTGYSDEEQMRLAEAVVVLGGDGTILRVSRQLARMEKEIPVLGVNLGRFGFLAETTVPEIHEALLALKEGDFTTSPRTMIQAEIVSGEGVQSLAPGLNEVVVSGKVPGRMGIISLYVDGQWVTTYRADGVILATTTGSTAHSMAAGGPILHPDVPAWVLTAICSHSLGVRSLVIPDRAVVTLRSEQEDSDLQVIVDGQEHYSFSSNQDVRLQKNETRFLLVASKQRNFYEIVREKFNLGDAWAARRKGNLE